MRRRLRVGVVGLTAVVACQFTPGVLPRDGATDDAERIPDAGMCASASSECAGADVLRTCASAGSPAEDVPCVWGCVSGAPAHCGVLVPAGGGVAPTDVVGTGVLDTTLTGPLIIDGDTGAIGTSGDATSVRDAELGVDAGIDFQTRGAGDRIAMFRFKRLTISGDIKLVGSRPIALVADEGMTIDGTIDARGDCVFVDVDLEMRGGPGGFAGAVRLTNAAGSGAGAAPGASNKGGGGGGNGGSGGLGGNMGGEGGASWVDPAITFLVGGGGGGGGSGGGNAGAGGGGGGAIQLVANGPIMIGTGGINAGGCGGRSGTGGNDGGGGGGAGGTILIEAPDVTVDGALAVNGGGGGGADTNAQTVGSAGSLDRVRAAGAPAESAANGAVGGLGAAGSAVRGDEGGTMNSDGGGGGGGIGRIRINTRRGVAPSIGSAAVLSPSPTDPDTTFSSGSAAVE